MVTLHLKTKIPKTRHLTLDLDLPNTIVPGEAEIVLIFNSMGNDNQETHHKYNRQLQEKLLTFSVWTDDDFSGFKDFREEINKWQPEEF
jgi:hypothetical protein